MVLILIGDGLDYNYTELGTDAHWVRDEYTEPREHPFDCCVCERAIEEWSFWTCLDGGEAAHEQCVVVVWR